MPEVQVFPSHLGRFGVRIRLDGVVLSLPRRLVPARAPATGSPHGQGSLAGAKLSVSPSQPPPRRPCSAPSPAADACRRSCGRSRSRSRPTSSTRPRASWPSARIPTALVHAHQVVASSATSASTSRAASSGAFLHSPLLPVLNYVYLAAQNLVLPASLVLLYRLNRATYRTLRNTLLATWLLSLPVYALYPAAPPRLAGLGIVDTVSTGSPLKLEGRPPRPRSSTSSRPSPACTSASRSRSASPSRPRCATRSCASPRSCGGRSCC